MEAQMVNPALNALVQDLLVEGSGKVLMVGGFFGQTRDDHIRLYADLSLHKYLEIAKADIVRIIENPDKPEQPSMVFFKTTAELKYVLEASFRADQAVAAMVAICPGCGAHASGTAAQQTGGGGIGSLGCQLGCITDGVFCFGQNPSSWKMFWCTVEYLVCRLGCWWKDNAPTPV
jgi:hypothetical protein